jgi:uncharacterized protein YkwD
MSTAPSTPAPSARDRVRLHAGIVAVVVLLAALIAGSPTAGAHMRARTQAPAEVALPDPLAAEGDFVARINQLRTSRGLGPLTVDPQLTAVAREWAATMAAQGRIFHASDLSRGVSADWQKLGENVGVGSDVAGLFQAFVNSPSHLANLVDPAFTRVGVGVVNSGGRLYTAHRFMALAPPPPPPTVPPTTAAPTTVPPTTAAPSTVAPTTVPPTTTAPTIAAPVTHKLGPIERIAALIATPDTSADTLPGAGADGASG